MPSIQKKSENLRQLSSSYLSNYQNTGFDLDLKSACAYISEKMFQFPPYPTASMATPRSQHIKVIKCHKRGKAVERYQRRPQY